VTEGDEARPRVEGQGHDGVDAGHGARVVQAEVGQRLGQGGRVGLDGLQVVVVLNVVLDELVQGAELAGHVLVRDRVQEELAQLEPVLLRLDRRRRRCSRILGLCRGRVVPHRVLPSAPVQEECDGEADQKACDEASDSGSGDGTGIVPRLWLSCRWRLRNRKFRRGSRRRSRRLE